MYEKPLKINRIIQISVLYVVNNLTLKNLDELKVFLYE